MKTLRWRAAATCGPIVCFGACAIAQGQYLPGYTWNRQSDWVAGTAPGTSINNPSPDGLGRPTWQYEWVSGGGRLDSRDTWYAQPGHAMTWDSAWWNVGLPAWSRGDNQSPPIHEMVMTHNLVADQYSFVPVIRWLSPLRTGSLVDITGDLRIRWSGPDRVGSPVDVDVVIALMGQRPGDYLPLLEQTVSKPINAETVGDSITLPVDFRSITLLAGDSIVFSFRGAHDFAPYGRWVDMFDQINITAVPAPGTALLLTAIGVVATRRRRG
jgi:hypothetical protein